MWKISVVMLVTTAFAGLLIYNPYEGSAQSAASPIDTPAKPANVAPTPAPVVSVPVAEAPTANKDAHVIVLKVLADRVVAEDASDVVGADKAVATIAVRPLAASNASLERPVVQSADQTAVVQRVSRRREDPTTSSVDAALPDQPVAAALPQPSLASRIQERPVLQTPPQSPVVHPVLGRRDDPTAPRTDGTPADRPVVATN